VAIYIVDPPSTAGDGTVPLDREARSVAAENRRQQIRDVVTPVEDAARAAGATGISRPQFMPALFTSLTPEAIVEIARRPDVTLVVSAMVEHGDDFGVVCEGITSAKIDTAMNALGLFGEGQKIGLLDNPGCAINDKHEALASNTVVYLPTPRECTSDTDCTASNKATCNPSNTQTPSVCSLTRDGKKHCIDVHSSRVSSVIAASQGASKFGAAEATIYIPTNGDKEKPDMLHCSPAAMAVAYDALYGETKDDPVPMTVNESWGCEPPLAADGVTEDYYAKQYGMMIVKSSGNQSSSPAYGCWASNARMHCASAAWALVTAFRATQPHTRTSAAALRTTERILMSSRCRPISTL
jgi:hypothetical protein